MEAITQTFENFIASAQSEVTIIVVIVNLALAFGVGLIIAAIYQRTHMGLSYSRPFLTTIVVLSLLGATVMMVVAQNFIGAFALLGAFALIRFRTILKETRDIVFVFFALVEGVAVGMSNYTIAIVSTVIISAILLFLQYIHFGKMVRGGYLLTVISKSPFNIDGNQELSPHILYATLLHAKSIDKQSTEYMFDITLKNRQNVHALLPVIRNTDGVEHAELVSGDNSVEY